jgi:hypothetical protein
LPLLPLLLRLPAETLPLLLLLLPLLLNLLMELTKVPPLLQLQSLAALTKESEALLRSALQLVVPVLLLSQYKC